MDSRYQFTRESLLTVKDQPHREMTATRTDYGLPKRRMPDDDVLFSEKSTPESDVVILQPDIQEVEVTVA